VLNPISVGGWLTSSPGYNSGKGAFIFNLGVPMFAWGWQTWDLARRTEPFRCASGAGSHSYASAKLRLAMASSISWVFLKPIVALSTLAFWKANLMAFTRSS
jgi:hypothetical protein